MRHAADAVRTSRDKNLLRKMSPRPQQQSNEGNVFPDDPSDRGARDTFQYLAQRHFFSKKLPLKRNRAPPFPKRCRLSKSKKTPFQGKQKQTQRRGAKNERGEAGDAGERLSQHCYSMRTDTSCFHVPWHTHCICSLGLVKATLNVTRSVCLLLSRGSLYETSCNVPSANAWDMLRVPTPHVLQ